MQEKCNFENENNPMNLFVKVWRTKVLEIQIFVQNSSLQQIVCLK
jgi:hypothetical protein